MATFNARTARTPLFVALLMTVIAGHHAFGAAAADPDWPCVQRLVPVLTADGVWSGPPLSDNHWRQVPEVAGLVASITPGSVREAGGVQAIREFSEPLDAEARRRLLPLVLSGVLDETNQLRQQVIERIIAFARRQRGLAETVQRLTEQLDAARTGIVGTDMSEEAILKRSELEQRVFFATKTFQDAERTVRYMCDVPVRLEARFGAYARALEMALPAPP